MAGEGARAHYALDAPGVVVGNAAAGVAALAGAGAGWAALRRRHPVAAVVVAGWLGVWGLVAAAQAGLMVRSSRSGKLWEGDRLLEDLPWRGDEWVLDVGCGRGLLLIGAAKRLTSGRAVGLDLWRRQDQAGNDPASTMANAGVEGVAERVEPYDGDARRRPALAAPLRDVPAGASGDRHQAPASRMNGESPASRPGSEARGDGQVMNSLSSVTTLRLGMAPMRRFFSTPPMKRARVGMLITP